jgi:putative oxidoreductase
MGSRPSGTPSSTLNATDRADSGWNETMPSVLQIQNECQQICNNGYRDRMNSLALLVARIGLGIVFVAHGLQKLNDLGLDGVTAGFQKMGVPAPELSAYYSTFVELIGGAALLAGAFTAIAGLLLVGDMLGALLIVHLENGVFIGDNGYELVVALGVGALLLAVFGAGRYSIDGAIGPKVGRAGALGRP